MRLTQRTIKALKPDEFIWDRNLGVKCTGQGVRVFVLGYRLRSGRRRRITIGEYEKPWSITSAETEAKRLLGLVAGGVDPLEAKAAVRGAITLNDVLDRVIKEHLPKKKPKTAHDYRLIFDAILRPKLGRRPVADITRADVARMHHQLRDTPRQANLAVSILSKVLSLAELWGLRLDGSNPCRRIERYRETRRERALSDDEIARLGTALATAEASGTSIYALAAIRLLLFTGARPAEIFTLRWDAVDLERGLARLADSKVGRRSVFLNAGAVAVLSALPKVADNPYVIVFRKKHLRSVRKVWDQIRVAAALPDVRLYDLRHTAASVGADEGLSLPLIGKLLGHSQPSTTQRYAHIGEHPAKRAAEVIGTRITSALAGGR